MKRLLSLLLLIATPVLADVRQGADIVVLGEVHDNPDAHLGQAAIIQEVKPTAVVFEMLSPQNAKRADADHDSIPDIWATVSWPDFEIYQPILDALGDAAIVGAAASRETIRDVFAQGSAAIFGSDAAKYGLDVDLPKNQQTEREELQFLAHCEAMPKDMMSGMVEVQRFRDAQFARAALEALETYGPPVVLITGNGHARTDWGVPAYIKSAAPDVVAFTIAFKEVDEGAPFDVVHIVPEATRADPCEALENK